VIPGGDAAISVTYSLKVNNPSTGIASSGGIAFALTYNFPSVGWKYLEV
jgi:hypothetical protein